MQNIENSHDRKPLVSVVVPVYNVEEYVTRCVKSIIDQTYPNLEILLVDDGSTDRSGKICDSLATMDPRFQVIHQENAGLSGARNKGIELCSGEYIAFIDSDDFISKEFIRALVETACKTDSDIVQCYVKSFLYGEDTSDPAFEEGFHMEDVNIVRFTGREMCQTLLDTAYEDCGVVWNKLYKATVLEKLRFPLQKIHEDDFLVGKLYWHSAHVTIFEKPMYYYQYKRPDSIMNKKYSLKRLDGLEARKEQFEFFEEVGDQELYEKAKAEFIRETTRQIRELRKSDIADKEKIESDLRKEAVSYLNACLFGRYLSLRTRVGLITRLLATL